MITIPQENMLHVIQHYLSEKKPASITRFGDGEAMVLNGFNDMHALKLVMKRQFGYVPPIDEIEAIRNNLIQAYTDADIIGVPVNKRLDDKKSYWYRAFNILTENVGIEVLQGKDLTSIDFHSHFLDEGYWHKLLDGRDTLCYISCRDLDEAFKRRYGIKNVWSYIIAPEMKFDLTYSGKKHYPDQFNEIRRWVTKIPVEGNLCLVGAGVAGKIYNSWFKERGGISVDAGSCFDDWAGKVTRGPNRGAESFDDTHKL